MTPLQRHVSPLLHPPPAGRACFQGRARSRHQRVAAASSEGQAEGEGADRAQALELLNRLFYAAEAPHQLEDAEPAGAGTELQPGPAPPPLPSLIEDLPLWRVQWAALPGFQELYHIHVPHYTAMFSRLLRSPRPWRFGHLYLPSGSSNLGNPEYALAPGSQAPLVGTLMEVLQAVRLPDGRLLVLAVAIGRFKVVRALQEVPYSRADVIVLPDYEEVQAFQGVALESLEAGGPGGALSVAAAMQASVVAAEQAAAAASQVWWRHEVAAAAREARQRGRRDMIVASNEEEARAFGKRLVAIASSGLVAGLPSPALEAEEWPSDSEEEEEEQQQEQQQQMAAGSRAGDAEAAAVGGFFGGAAGAEPPKPPGCEACAAEADAAAHAAAGATIAALLATTSSSSSSAAGGSGSGAAGGSAAGPGPGLSQGLGFGSGWLASADAALAPGFSLAHASAGALQGVNSTGDRGVPSLPQAPIDLASEGAGAPPREEPLDGSGASRSLALRLEVLAWRELDAVCHLVGRLRQRPLPLGEGLLQLRPPGIEPPPGSGGGGEGASMPHTAPALHPAYPPLRRAQRLSFALASILNDISSSEGRQALLEAPSISARLRLVMAGLHKHRSVLAAVVAVQELSPGEGERE